MNTAQNVRQRAAEVHTALRRRRRRIVGVDHHRNYGVLGLGAHKLEHARKGMAEPAVIAGFLRIRRIETFFHEAVNKAFGDFGGDAILGAIFRFGLI